MDLEKILRDHKMWLDGKGGERANLHGADLGEANLRGSNLGEANLRWADLHGADLHVADLRGADFDFSCWPLWCGSLCVTLDEQQQRQLAYHLAAVLTVDAEWVAGMKEFANGWNGIKRYGLSKIE